MKLALGGVLLLGSMIVGCAGSAPKGSVTALDAAQDELGRSIATTSRSSATVKKMQDENPYLVADAPAAQALGPARTWGAAPTELDSAAAADLAANPYSDSAPKKDIYDPN